MKANPLQLERYKYNPKLPSSLLDGVEMIEGDILAKECFWWIIVEFDKGSFMARDFDKTRYNNKILNKHLSDINLDGWRVIGNIYQNYK